MLRRAALCHRLRTGEKLAVVAAVLMLVVPGSLTIVRYETVRARVPEVAQRVGVVRPVSASVRAPTGGLIRGLLADQGAIVAAGQPILQLQDLDAVAGLRAAEEALAAAESLVGDYALRSPVSGTVLRVYRTSGGLIPENQPILAIGDSGALYISVASDAVKPLPSRGQTVWIYSRDSFVGAASVFDVTADNIRVSVPLGAGLAPEDPIAVRFDPQTDPLVMVSGTVTGDLVLIRAHGDGRLTSVAEVGAVVAAGDIVASVARVGAPDAAQAMAIVALREKVEIARRQAAPTTVVAPMAGRLSWLQTTVGTTAAPGEVLGLVASAETEIALSAPVGEAMLWRAGASVQVASGTHRFQETVTAVTPRGDLLEVTLTAPRELGNGVKLSVMPAIPGDVVAVPKGVLRNLGDRHEVVVAGLVSIRRVAATIIAEYGNQVLITGVEAGTLVVARSRLSRLLGIG